MSPKFRGEYPPTWTKEFRDALVCAIKEAQEMLRLYDLSLVPGEHTADCPCPRGSCTFLRLDALPPIQWEPGEWEAFHEAISHA